MLEPIVLKTRPPRILVGFTVPAVAWKLTTSGPRAFEFRHLGLSPISGALARIV